MRICGSHLTLRCRLSMDFSNLTIRLSTLTMDSPNTHIMLISIRCWKRMSSGNNAIDCFFSLPISLFISSFRESKWNLNSLQSFSLLSAFADNSSNLSCNSVAPVLNPNLDLFFSSLMPIVPPTHKTNTRKTPMSRSIWVETPNHAIAPTHCLMEDTWLFIRLQGGFDGNC